METSVDNAKPQTRTKRVTQEHVLDAALTLVLEGGVSAVSLRKIAARVNCAAPTLYYYFRSKQEILEKLWSRQIEQVLEHSLKYPQLEDALFQYGHYWMIHRSLFQLMFTEGEVNVEDLSGYLQLYEAIEKKFQDRGLSEDKARQRTQIALAAIHGLVLSSVHRYLESPEAETLLADTIHLVTA